MGDVKMCIETIWRNWRSLPCGKPAKYGDYCGIHSPEKKAERAKARGPTQWEVDCANRKAEADELATLRTELEKAKAALDAEVVAKDGAYNERDQLVSALSKCFPSWLRRHPDDDAEWEDEWRWIVMVQLPTGQVSWHIHDTELPLFHHIGLDSVDWDGHDNEEKYRRIRALRDAKGEE